MIAPAKNTYKEVRFPVVTKVSNSTVVSTVVDSGCQSCLCDLATIRKVGLHFYDLIPTKYTMVRMKKSKVNILGCLFLRISGLARSGEVKWTKQLVYVMDQCSRLYLSQETYITLEILLREFPRISVAIEDSSEMTHMPAAPCNCPL
jgi:hypothetical protein